MWADATKSEGEKFLIGYLYNAQQKTTNAYGVRNKPHILLQAFSWKKT